MCIGYMQILRHVCKGLEHPQILISVRVLRPVPCGCGGMTAFSVAPHTTPRLPHAPALAASPWPALFLLSRCHFHPFMCLGSPCSGVSTQLIVSSPGNLPWAPGLVQGSALGIPPLPMLGASSVSAERTPDFRCLSLPSDCEPLRGNTQGPSNDLALSQPRLPSPSCGPKTRCWRLYMKDR